MKLDSKIYVAGHRGLVGSAILEKLKEFGYTNIITKTRSELDLMDPVTTKQFFLDEKPEYVFASAAKVGGINANNTYPADFIYENLVIQNNLIHFSNMANVKKFAFLATACIYPKLAQTPVKEEYLFTGNLEPTNEAYSTAKIAGIKMCQAYYRQYGLKSVCVIPSNLYGPNDNFHLDNGHVIPAMFRKFEDNPDSVTFWGDGSPCREFLYSHDMADACIFLMNSEVESGEMINVGSGVDISIKDLAKIISHIVNYRGQINWDTTRPNGAQKRPLDFSKIMDMGWKPKYSFEQGLKETYNWYKHVTYTQTR